MSAEFYLVSSHMLHAYLALAGTNCYCCETLNVPAALFVHCLQQQPAAHCSPPIGLYVCDLELVICESVVTERTTIIPLV